ncbi:hypothetical protein [Catenuloplanes indicus]|uniref:Uncharacterized protein n=1 Tax=Catenuloplanes indicus TaxID=137267 RepID=A0AAE4AX20_9ACTN|nr:hypothetical protein [Catenuloplanes indicus]MDQ0366555.1 hypothetical protein [Catenuloplanes indicus]
MAAVTFSMDQYDAPVYHATDRRWSSSDYEVSFSPTAFTVSNNWLPGAEGSYPIDLVRSVVEDYWHFLAGQPEREVVRQYRPDLPEFPGPEPIANSRASPSDNGHSASCPAQPPHREVGLTSRGSFKLLLQVGTLR